jgi:hypothetical protein
MRRATSIGIALTAVVIAALAVVPLAWAPWRGLNDLNYDDRGRICSDGMEFALANSFGGGVVTVRITEVDPTTLDEIRELLPATALAPLQFNPVPELTNAFAPYYHSRVFRLAFAVRPAAGATIRLDFSGGIGIAGSTIEDVGDCRLHRAFLGFAGAAEPPAFNTIAPGKVIRVGFLALGVDNAGQVETSLTSIPCVASQPPFDPVVEPVTIQVSQYRRVAFTVSVPTDPAWRGCKQLSVRTPLDGLVQRLNFNFG